MRNVQKKVQAPFRLSLAPAQTRLTGFVCYILKPSNSGMYQWTTIKTTVRAADVLAWLGY